MTFFPLENKQHNSLISKNETETYNTDLKILVKVCTGDVTNAVTSEQVLSVEGSEMSILIKAFIEGICLFCFYFNGLENSLGIMVQTTFKNNKLGKI